MIDDRAVEAAAPMADLAALIERLEKLTGPSKEVNWLIADQFGMVPEHSIREIGFDYEWFRHPGEFVLWKALDAEGRSVTYWLAPEYTASLDAVIALIERELPGWRIEMRIGEWPPHYPGGVVLWNNDTKAKTSVFGIAAKGATPAIALMIALLRSKPNGGDNG